MPNCINEMLCTLMVSRIMVHFFFQILVYNFHKPLWKCSDANMRHRFQRLHIYEINRTLYFSKSLNLNLKKKILYRIFTKLKYFISLMNIWRLEKFTYMFAKPIYNSNIANIQPIFFFQK